MFIDFWSYQNRLGSLNLRKSKFNYNNFLRKDNVSEGILQERGSCVPFKGRHNLWSSEKIHRGCVQTASWKISVDLLRWWRWDNLGLSKRFVNHDADFPKNCQSLHQWGWWKFLWLDAKSCLGWLNESLAASITNSGFEAGIRGGELLQTIKWTITWGCFKQTWNWNWWWNKVSFQKWWASWGKRWSALNHRRGKTLKYPKFPCFWTFWTWHKSN